MSLGALLDNLIEPDAHKRLLRRSLSSEARAGHILVAGKRAHAECKISPYREQLFKAKDDLGVYRSMLSERSIYEKDTNRKKELLLVDKKLEQRLFRVNEVMCELNYLFSHTLTMVSLSAKKESLFDLRSLASARVVIPPCGGNDLFQVYALRYQHGNVESERLSERGYSSVEKAEWHHYRPNVLESFLYADVQENFPLEETTLPCIREHFRCAIDGRFEVNTH